MKVLITIGFMVFDFLTGIISAIKNKEFTSSVMRNGGFHKFGSITAIGLGLAIDFAQEYIDLGYTIPISTAICCYICLMEIGSIMENIGKINPELLPDKIKSIFQKLNKDGKEE